MDIGIAVIARPESRTLDACRSALREAGATAEVVEIGSDGPGMARNRALAACRGEVLALVEDDVAVGRGWREALEVSWRGAAVGVAVIGGPLRLRVLGRRPPWLVAGLGGAFGVLDLGDEQLDLSLGARTLHGGNVSFRCDALRGAGGFWPARGHPDGRDWFSDEHHAQQALGELGWRGCYEPAACAERLVTAADLRARTLIRRRARYGARLAAVGGGRPKGTAARAVATGGASALAGRDRARAVERAARAAENLGALVGGRLVARDFEPVASRTAFRPSVPMPVRRSRGRRRDGALILLYHRVADAKDDPLRLSVSPRAFEEQLDVLVATRRVVGLEEVAAEREAGTVAVTFDDGYRDNATAAAPALAARGLPWTLFACTGHVENGCAFWWDEVTCALETARPEAAAELRLALPGGPRAWRVGTSETRRRARIALSAALQDLDPDGIALAVDSLRQWARSSSETDALARPMSIGDLRELAGAGVAIGAHTRRHRSLASATAEDQRAEIARSRADLESWLGRPPTSFAYPFGVPGADLNDLTMRIVRDAGFSCAVVNSSARVDRTSDRFALPRAAVPNVRGDEFARWLLALDD